MVMLVGRRGAQPTRGNVANPPAHLPAYLASDRGPEPVAGASLEGVSQMSALDACLRAAVVAAIWWVAPVSGHKGFSQMLAMGDHQREKWLG